MENNQLCQMFAKELQAEYTSTKKCLERISSSLFDYKPHPTSMSFGYLALLVAEIPLWLTATIKEGEVDFVTFKHIEPTTNEQLVAHFEENFAGAKTALEAMTDDELAEPFVLRNGETELMKASKGETISSTINHWVHHRGQLTVYMRMTETPVPSIYGPSADDKQYANQVA
jgi:uncharacterized damage-inducible protein DinB